MEGWSFQNNMSACAGAEVNIDVDGSFHISLVKISLQKKLIHIDKKKDYKASLENMTEEPIKEPLAVSLSGKGVLIKKVPRMEAVTEQNLQHVFPNLVLSEFYVQHFLSGDYSFLSIVRIEVADAVLEAFRKQGSEVMILSLGPFVVDKVLSQLNIYGGDIHFHGHQLLLNDKKDWLDYKYSPDVRARFVLKIDIETMPEEFLLAYATAFQLILNESMELVEVENETIKKGLTELSASRKFKRNGTWVLASFFVFLLMNFFVFSYYSSKNEQLLSRAGQQSDFSVHKDKLIADVDHKEEMIKKLGWNKGLRYAFLCDQIGQTTPSSVILTELSINPLINKSSSMVREEKSEAHSIRLKGQAASVYVINDWIHTLKKKPWVKGVQLEKYKTDDQVQKQVFTILLNY